LRLRLLALGIAAGLALLSACDGRQAEPPPPPPQLQSYDRFPFGDAVASRAENEVARVVDVLAPRFGRTARQSFKMASDADWDAIRHYYDQALLPAGWKPLADMDRASGRGQRAFGYYAGRRFLAVVALEPRPGDAAVPVDVLRDERRPTLPRPRPAA